MPGAHRRVRCSLYIRLAGGMLPATPPAQHPMDALTLRPRTASEIADAAFNLFRSNAKLLLVIAAVMYIPITVVNVVFMPPQSDLTGGAFTARYILAIIGLFWSGLISGALAYAASARYLGTDTSAGEAITAAFKRTFRLGVGMVLRWMLVGAGVILLFVGSVYAFIFSFAMIQAMILENLGINAAWTRSRELVRDNKKHVFATLLIAYIVLFVVFIAVVLIGAPVFLTNERILQVVQSAASVLIFPFVVCAETLLYYDLRIRKEGFDIEHLAGRMEPAAAGIA